MDYFTEFKSEGFERQRLFRMPNRTRDRAASLPFTQDCLVTDVGYYPKARKHFVNRPVGTTSHVFIFCLRGKGWYQIENSFGELGKRRTISQGAVLYFRPNEAHRYGSHDSEEWEIYWLHCSGAVVEYLLKWSPFSGKKRLQVFANGQAIKRQFNTILQQLEIGYSDHVILELSRFFLTIISLLHREAGTQQQLVQREKIESAMDNMRESVAEFRDLSYYAKGVGLSVSQFSYLFRTYNGISPMAFLTELRMRKARELLESSSISVKEIASRLGYEDPLYFSRQFKKNTGLSPTSYRAES